MSRRYGDSTCSLKAIDVQSISCQPVAPQAVLAATYHVSDNETGALGNWGDPVADGFARISLGIEDTDDLLADIERADGLPLTN